MAASDSDWTDNPNVQSWLATPSSQEDMPTTQQPTTTLRPYPSAAFDDADAHSENQWEESGFHDAMTADPGPSELFDESATYSMTAAPQHNPYDQRPPHPKRTKTGRMTRVPRWVLLLIGAVVVVVLGVGAVLALTGDDDQPTPTDAFTIPSQAATHAADADCPSSSTGDVTTGRDSGGTDSGPNVIKAFEHAYYVTRSGADARAFAAPTAQIGTAEQIQTGIDSIDEGTLYCTTITDRGAGLYALELTEIRLRGEAPVTYHQLVQTTSSDGRTWIVSIKKDTGS